MNKETEESDSEFWVSYDAVPDLQEARLAAALKERMLKERFRKAEEPEVGIQNSSEWVKSFYHDKLSRVRESKEVEITTSTIITRNKTRNTYISTIEDLKSKHSRDLYKLKSDFLLCKDILTEKDSYISEIITILGEVGLLFSEITINNLNFKHASAKQALEAPEIMALITEVKNLNTQVSYLKEVCHLYQKDTEKAYAKAHHYQDEYEKLEKFHKLAMDTKAQEIIQLEITHQTEKGQLKQEMIDRKISYEKEIEALRVIQIRQQEYITQLQEEIKNAKIVLQNRNLRNKLFDKLKDYMENGEKDTKEVQKSQLPLFPNKEIKPTHSRKHVKSTSRSLVESFISDSMVKRSQSIQSSINMPIFTRKITSGFHGTEIHPRPFTPNA